MSAFKQVKPEDVEAHDKAQNAKAVQQLKRDIVWTLKLTDNSVSSATLKSAIPHLLPSTWDEIIDERQLANHCGYPTCQNEPSRSYDPTNLPSLKLSGNRIKNVKSSSQFCSALCMKKSRYFREECLVRKSTTLIWEDIDPNELMSLKNKGPPQQEAPSLVIPSAPPLMDSLKIVENPMQAKGDQFPAPPSAGQADFEAPSQKHHRPVARPFILGKKMRLQQPATSTVPAKQNVVIAPPDVTQVVEAFAKQTLIGGDTGEEDGPFQVEEDEDPIVRDMIAQALLLRQELQAKGEME